MRYLKIMSGSARDQQSAKSADKGDDLSRLKCVYNKLHLQIIFLQFDIQKRHFAYLKFEHIEHRTHSFRF